MPLFFFFVCFVNYNSIGFVFDFILFTQKRRPPQFFTNLRECLRIMVKCFKCGDVERSCVERETLAETERLLQLHGYETCDLIHRYYVQRYREQTKMNDTPYGQLTIRAHFTADDYLEVNTMEFQSQLNRNVF